MGTVGTHRGHNYVGLVPAAARQAGPRSASEPGLEQPQEEAWGARSAAGSGSHAGGRTDPPEETRPLLPFRPWISRRFGPKDTGKGIMGNVIQLTAKLTRRKFTRHVFILDMFVFIFRAFDCIFLQGCVCVCV